MMTLKPLDKLKKSIEFLSECLKNVKRDLGRLIDQLKKAQSLKQEYERKAEFNSLIHYLEEMQDDLCRISKQTMNLQLNVPDDHEIPDSFFKDFALNFGDMEDDQRSGG